MKIVNTLEVPRLYSQKDDRFRYEAVKENVLGLKNICGEIVVYPPGASGASHHHVGTEHLFYITEGRGTMYVNEAPHEVKAGDFIAVFEGERHWFLNQWRSPSNTAMKSPALTSCGASLTYIVPRPSVM